MWRDASKRAQAAEALKITAQDVKALGCVDDIVPEPEGGAQANAEEAARLLEEKLSWHFDEIKGLPVDELLSRRYKKFRNIAQFYKT